MCLPIGWLYLLSWQESAWKENHNGTGTWTPARDKVDRQECPTHQRLTPRPMLWKIFRVRLIDKELLSAIGKNGWHIDITAPDLASAWRKFVTQKRWPATFAGSLPNPANYDVHLERTESR